MLASSAIALGAWYPNLGGGDDDIASSKLSPWLPLTVAFFFLLILSTPMNSLKWYTRTTSITSKGQDGKLENMEKPEQFPNLNPIKLLWDELDRINVRVPGSST
uniref:Uncharacterized protein n=1 Tax=Astatotilapia calliptera TaxID=8154 RepID=A0A3P8NJB1_ASTCA